MGNEEMPGGLLTVHSRTAFSAGLYDILNTGNLDQAGQTLGRPDGAPRHGMSIPSLNFLEEPGSPCGKWEC